jgi:hypothetical protein
MRHFSLLMLLCACGGDWSETDLIYSGALPARSTLRAPDGGTQWNGYVDGLTAMSEQSRTLTPLTRTETSRTWGPYADDSDSTRELELVIDRVDEIHFKWRVESRVSGGPWLGIISATSDLEAHSGVIDSPVASYRDTVTVIDSWKTLDAISLSYGDRQTLTLNSSDGGITVACWSTSEAFADCN